MLEYPQRRRRDARKAGGHRSLSLGDYPPKADKWSAESEQYLIDHGISPARARLSPYCYPTKGGTICFLMHGVQTYQERVHTSARWNNPGSVPSARAVFIPSPLRLSEQAVVLVEGTTDALRLWATFGLDAVSYMGTFIPAERIQTITKLVRGKRLYIIPDNDPAGQYGLRRMLTEFPTARALLLPSTYKDVCSAPTNVMSELLNREKLL